MLEAELIELNILVAGKTDQQLVEEIANAIECHYQFAKERGLTPFADLFPDNPRMESLVPIGEMLSIPLPPEVAEALAIALHALTPGSLRIQTVRVAA